MLGTAVCSCSTIHRLMQTFGLYWWIECSWWTKNCFLLWRKDDVETQKHQAVTLMFTACGKWLARNVIKEKQNKTHIWKSEIYFLIKRSSFHRVTLYDAHYQRVTEHHCMLSSLRNCYRSKCRSQCLWSAAIFSFVFSLIDCSKVAAIKSSQTWSFMYVLTF